MAHDHFVSPLCCLGLYRDPGLSGRGLPGPESDRQQASRCACRQVPAGESTTTAPGGMAVPLGPASTEQPPFRRPPIGNSKAIRPNRGPQPSLTVFTVA